MNHQHMKKYIIILLSVITIQTALAQDFQKNLASARSSYQSGDLENARFAMEQLLRDVDAVIGKEILKLLPVKFGAMSSNAADESVSGSGASLGTGLFVHRSYGAAPAKTADLQIINNSPLITGINAMLAIPFVTGNAGQKQVKIQGYKALLKTEPDSETGKNTVEIQLPFGNTLLTLRVTDSNEAEVTGFVNQVPLAKIAGFAQ